MDDGRPPPPTPEVKHGVTFSLRFDNELLGKRTIGKVRLEMITDAQAIGDPLAMFESMFLDGNKELVIEQVLTDADRFMGGQKVNQFARIRPDDPESRAEINKLTIAMQNTRQPVSDSARSVCTFADFILLARCCSGA